VDRLELGEPRLDPAPVRTQAFLGVVAGEDPPDLVERDVELTQDADPAGVVTPTLS
jgi:hypothetical protein